MKNILVVLVCLAGLIQTACNKDSDRSATTSGGGGGNTTASTSDIRKIVSAGVGINFNNMTGGQIEMALHPATHTPSVVYYDKSQQVIPGAPAGALKFATMDALGNWSVEVIDSNYGTGACGVAATAYCIGAQNIATVNFPQIFSIAYIPASGTTAAYPMVVYAHGNTLATGKRIRAAVRNPSTGVWTITDAVPSSSISSGIMVTLIEHPIKGIRLLVDANGLPHLYFGLYETTGANSRLKYTMKKADGLWTSVANVAPAGFNLSTTFTYAAATGVIQAGAAMCPTNGMAVLAYPAADNAPVTAGGANQPWLLSCSAVDVNGTCTTWGALDLVTGCAGVCLTGTGMTAAGTNAGNRLDLSIDPTTNKIILGMYSTLLPATQTIAAVQAGADTCAAFSTTAFSTQAYPTASQGVNGVKVMSSNANYYNSSAQNALLLTTTAAGAAIQLHKATLSPLAAWTAANTVSVEPTTTAGVLGGLAFDPTNSVVWGAYSVTTGGAAGAIGNDVKVFAAYESDVATPGGITNNWVVDQTMSVFPSAAAPVIDAAIASNGTVGYTYFFTELGATPGAASHLYYGIKGGPSNSPVFGEKVVYNAGQGTGTFLVGQHPSLTYDSASNPLITFQDALTAAQGLLMLARSSNGGVSFAVEKVDGLATGNSVGTYSSVQVASDGTIGISYYDATNSNLKFAKRSPAGAWRRFAVDGPTGSCAMGTTAGAFSRLRWTSANKPVIAYQATAGGVKYLRLAFGEPDTDARNYTWTCLTLDSTGQASNARGEGIDFILDSAGRPLLVHQDTTVGRIRYLRCASSVATCVTAGASSFASELVEAVGTIVPNQSRPAIALDSNGKVYISYYNGADKGLYIKSKDPVATTTAFQYLAAEAIEVPVDGALYTNPAGQYAELLINSSNNPMLFYRSMENWLKFFSRETQ